MTPLATSLLEEATRAMIEARGVTPKEAACSVLVAVLARLGGTKGQPGMFPHTSALAQNLLALADEIEEGAPTHT